MVGELSLTDFADYFFAWCIKGLKRKTSPGKHKLTAYAPSGIISTPFEFEVEQDKSYHIEMDYKSHVKDAIYDVFGVSITIIE